MTLKQTMRWYGPDDPVSLADIHQAGATGVVTALHHVPNGESWSVEQILERKQEIENAGLEWSVVESVGIHEDIKRRTGDCDLWIRNYATTIKNLARCGIKTVCYNFMPVVDWTRTDLHYRLPNGAEALRFDRVAFAAFDIFMLKRVNASDDHGEALVARAKEFFEQMNEEERTRLEDYIVAGLPGGTTDGSSSLDEFRQVLDTYAAIGPDQLRDNLAHFLSEIIPVAEEQGVNMTIHPDDPPFSLLGLPRVVSTATDFEFILNTVDSPANGVCFCTGSLGARLDNDLPAMARQFAHRINFIHLRAVKVEGDGSFHEDNHLEGSVDMYEVLKALLEEQQNRQEPIPMRPDHGHRMLYDLQVDSNPGYSAIGRLKGLAELRGLEHGILKSLNIK